MIISRFEKSAFFSIIFWFSMLPVAQATVTYNGTNGVSEQIIEPVCADCHYAGNPDGLPNWTSYATASANSALMFTYVDAEVMPPDPYPPLSNAQKTLLQNWDLAGAPLQFAPTTATSVTVDNITKTSARVFGSAVPHCDSTTGDFQYGVSPIFTTNSSGNVAISATCNNSATGTAFNHTITDLSCGTEYSYRARAVNGAGTGTGTVRSFVTTSCDLPEIDQGLAVTVPMSVNGNPNAFALQLSASGDISDTFIWSISAQPPAGGGTASVTGGATASGELKTISYTPPTDTSGSFEFTVMVTGNSGSAATVVTVDVGLAMPAIDQGTAIVRSTPPAVSLEIGLSATDADSSQLTWSVASPASDGTVNIPVGTTVSGEVKTITYTPGQNINELSADTFTIGVVDESGHVDDIPITVNVVSADVLAGYIIFDARQAGNAGFYVLQSDGIVTVTGTMSIPPVDPDAQSFDWSGSSSDLLNIASINGGTFSFDPITLPAGHFILDLRVSKGGMETRNRAVITVLGDATIPAADDQFDCNNDDVVDSSEDDCDGDGILNLADGVRDRDDDGVPDYLDAMDDPVLDVGLLPNQTGDALNSRFLVVEPGLRIRLGMNARMANRSGALISVEDIAEHGGVDGGSATNAQDTFVNIGGIYDFEITGIQQAGDSAKVVIPLLTGIHAGAQYRKYLPTIGWRNFVTDSGNSIASAASILGACPAPGGSEYESWLNPFHNCVQLTIQDGGPNDADGEANGVIRDPGGVAVADVTPEHAPPPKPDDGSGGGALHPVWLLLLASLLAAFRVRRRWLH